MSEANSEPQASLHRIVVSGWGAFGIYTRVYAIEPDGTVWIESSTYGTDGDPFIANQTFLDGNLRGAEKTKRLTLKEGRGFSTLEDWEHELLGHQQITVDGQDEWHHIDCDRYQSFNQNETAVTFGIESDRTDLYDCNLNCKEN